MSRLPDKQIKKTAASGVFGKGRFKSQALLDEKVLANCMAYINKQSQQALMLMNLNTSINPRTIETRKN